MLATTGFGYTIEGVDDVVLAFTTIGTSLSYHPHRPGQPRPRTLAMDIVVSDVEPMAGALAAGLWEPDHARRTIKRLDSIRARQAHVRVLHGSAYVGGEAGVWVLSSITPAADDDGHSVRATLMFEEPLRGHAAIPAG